MMLYKVVVTVKLVIVCPFSRPANFSHAFYCHIFPTIWEPEQAKLVIEVRKLVVKSYWSLLLSGSHNFLLPSWLTNNVFVHKAQFDAGELITQREVVGLSQDYTFLNCIRHFHVRNEKGTEGKMRPAVVPGSLLWTRWSAIGHFFPSLVTAPKSLQMLNWPNSLLIC